MASEFLFFSSEQHVGSFRGLVPSRTHVTDGSFNGLAPSKPVTHPCALCRRGTDPSRRRMFHSSTQNASLPEHQVVAMPALSPVRIFVQIESNANKVATVIIPPYC